MNLKSPIYSRVQLLLIAGAVCLLLQNANATLLFSDGFNYTGGSALVPTDTQWNVGTGNAGLTIGSGHLTYSGLQDLGGNELSDAFATAGTAAATFANQTSGQVYYSFLLDVTTADGANDYVTSLNPGTTVPGGSGDAAALYVYKDNTLGIRGSGLSAVHTAGPVALNTTNLVVIDYDFSTASINLWLNPTPGGAQPSASETLAGGTVTAIDDVGVKSQSTTGNFLLGNMLIGTTWADVTPQAVPEPSTVMMVVSGLGLMLGLARRRH